MKNRMMKKTYRIKSSPENTLCVKGWWPLMKEYNFIKEQNTERIKAHHKTYHVLKDDGNEWKSISLRKWKSTPNNTLCVAK